ncbi:hypothetical protein LINGRAHAP2_LOCUS5257, partial [Linum grandiflorum]
GLKCEVLWRALSLHSPWVFGGLEFRRIPQPLLRSFQMAPRWITSMRFSSCSIKNSANDSGRLLSPIFTAKQIVLRTI